MSFVGSLVQYQPDSSPSGISGRLTAVTITGTAPNESVQVNCAPPTSTSIKVNAGDASACAVANGIATESCAGQGPGSPPSPVPHIS
jgi:hypothetical protein